MRRVLLALFSSLRLLPSLSCLREGRRCPSPAHALVKPKS